MNPFKPNVVVSGPDFIGRNDELKDLENRLSNSSTERILLIAPRRFGKTSLLHNVMNKLKKKKHVCIYLDLFSTLSIDDFANLLIKSVIESENISGLDKLINWVKENLFSLRASIKFTTNTQGDVSIEPIVFNNPESALERVGDVFKDLERLAKKQAVLIVFDEFQTILEWDKDHRLEKHLRTVFQNLQKVNIIFSGSQVRLLREIFESAHRPFFKQSNSLNLKPIDKKTFAEWIKNQFSDYKIQIDDDVVDEIIELSFGNPQQIQLLCYELWNKAELDKIKKIDKNIFEEELKILIQKRNNDFENLWMQLTKVQKQFLRALASEHKTNAPYGKDFCNKYALSPSSVQTVVDTLESKYLITISEGFYYVSDLMLRLWLEKSANKVN